jgi:hypothetical protein
MTSPRAQFEEHVRAIIRRYCQQNGGTELPETELKELSARMWKLVLARGLPAPLPIGQAGSPGEMSAAEVAPLVETVLGDLSRRGELLDPVRQLVKACFHREFAICRESYREMSSDGVCRRQQLKKALGRVSGSHCVDCPYWTSHAAKEHEELLGAAWVADRAEFESNRGVYLPEDFRTLRVWLHEAARSGWVRAQEG